VGAGDVGASSGEFPHRHPHGQTTGLGKGDAFTLQWRDARHAQWARGRRREIFSTSVQTVDSGQIWVPLDLRETTFLRATVILARGAVRRPAPARPRLTVTLPAPFARVFRGPEYFLADPGPWSRRRRWQLDHLHDLLLLAMLAI
jgi:hypothetical protein